MGYSIQFFARVFCLIILDLAAYYTALLFAVFIRVEIISLFYKPITEFFFNFPYFLSMWWIPLILAAVCAFEKLYTIRYPFWEEAKGIIKSVTIALLFVLFFVSIRRIFGDISRLTFLLLWIFMIVLLPFYRYWGKRFLFFTGIWRETVLVLGTGEMAVNTVTGLVREKQLGYDIAGFLNYPGDKAKQPEILGKKYPVLGSTDEYEKWIKKCQATTVIIAIPEISREKLSLLTSNVQKFAKTVMVVPDLAGIALINTEIHYLFMQKTFLLKIKNNLHSAFNNMIKRFFDFTISILFMPFILPFIGIVMILIKRDSEGPAMIIQERLGKGGKNFKCIKFRTMYMDADKMLDEYFEKNPEAFSQWKKYKKLKDFDPRVTKIGKFLRKTSLDEVPQIFNVLKGEMSLVGPRPYLPREKDEIKDYVDFILMTRPGMTGLWQISGRNELVFEERMKLDMWYIQNWSLWLDLIIFLSTSEVILKRKGAF